MKAVPAAAGRVGLGMAGFGLIFESDSKGIINVLRTRYGGFSVPGPVGPVFRAEEAPGGRAPFKPSVFSSGALLRLERGDFKAELTLPGGPGRLRAAANEQCLDAFLRSLISALLLRSGGLMLHCAGVVRRGRAYLFLGRSGAGKSTLSRLAAGAGCEVISDEINLLRPAGKGFRAHGSPFWGEMRADGRPGAWPLGGVFILRKARANRVIPCSKADALKAILRCLLNFEKGPGVSALALGAAAALLAGTEFGRLEFSKKDASFLELI